jgi:acyl dehydratase/molybdopterin converting factor small subunit
VSVTVKIPTPLRRLTKDQDIVQTEGGSLAEAISGLDGSFPGLKERLCDEQGQLRRFVNVYINGEDVRFLSGLQTPLKQGDEVSIVPAVAGGCSPPRADPAAIGVSVAEQRYFEDFSIGERFQAPSKTLTDAHFLFFAGLTGDSHPLHYDVEYAKNTRFGRPVAHGLMLAAMTALGAGVLAPLVQESIVAFVEQSTRFLAPAFTGDTIYPELEVVELTPKSTTGLLGFTARLTNQRGETVLEGRHAYLIKRRERGETRAG